MRDKALLTGCLVVAVLAALAGAWLWRAQESRPPSGDDARHLMHTTRLVRGLAAGEVEPVLFPDFSRLYPPLVHWTFAVFSGPRPTMSGLVAAQGLLLVLLAGAVLGAGRRLGGPWAGALGAVALLLSPILQVNLRSGFLEMGMTATVALAFLALLRTGGFRSPGPSTLAGAAVGLAALTKYSCALYLAAPVCLTWLGWFGRAPEGSRSRGTLAFVGGALLVAGPWYLAGREIFRRAMLFLGGAQYGASAGAPGSAEAFGWVAWNAVDWLWGVPLTALLAAALPGRRRSDWGVLACAFAPLLGLALVAHRHPHYLLGALPFAALFVGVGLAGLRARAAILALMTALAVWGSLSGVVLRPVLQPEPRGDHYGRAFVDGGEPGRLNGTAALLGGIPGSRDDWPVEDLVRTLSGLAEPVAEGQPLLYPVPEDSPGATLGVLGPWPFGLDAETLRLAIQQQGLRLRVGEVDPTRDPGRDFGFLLLHPDQPVPPGYEVVWPGPFPDGVWNLARFHPSLRPAP